MVFTPYCWDIFWFFTPYCWDIFGFYPLLFGHFRFFTPYFFGILTLSDETFLVFYPWLLWQFWMTFKHCVNFDSRWRGVQKNWVKQRKGANYFLQNSLLICTSDSLRSKAWKIMCESFSRSHNSLVSPKIFCCSAEINLREMSGWRAKDNPKLIAWYTRLRHQHRQKISDSNLNWRQRDYMSPTTDKKVDSGLLSMHFWLSTVNLIWRWLSSFET